MSSAAASELTQSASVKAIWSSGLASEVHFWDEVIKTGGLEWKKHWEDRFNPDQPLHPRYQRMLAAPPGATVRVLDVGAGPATSLGKKMPGRTIEMFAIDPLAREYNQALAQAGLTPPVRTQCGDGEHLTDYFPESFFHLVHARNALDHSYDPVAAIRQMLLVARPGALVQLDHSANEAVRQKYVGLHQWNFCIEHARLVVWREARRVDVLAELAALAAEVLVDDSDPAWVSVGIRKAAGA